MAQEINPAVEMPEILTTKSLVLSDEELEKRAAPIREAYTASIKKSFDPTIKNPKVEVPSNKLWLKPAEIPFDRIYDLQNKLQVQIGCLDCGQIIAFCEHNPNSSAYQQKKAIETRKVIEIKTITQNDENGEEITVRVQKTPGKRGRQRIFSETVPKEQEKEISEAYVNGGTLQDVSKQFKIAVVPLSEFLRSVGLLRQRGHMPPGKIRGRERTTQDITKAILEEAIYKLKAENATIALMAKEYNVNPMALSNALKEAGCEVRKGRREGVKVVGGGRIRQTQIVTPEITAKAVQAFKDENKGVVALAKEFNVNPAELSAAMKSAGCEIRRGKKSVKE